MAQEWWSGETSHQVRARVAGEFGWRRALGGGRVFAGRKDGCIERLRLDWYDQEY